MTPREYAKPEHFRPALEANLRAHATKTGVLYSRQIQLFCYDRFLARVTQYFGDAVTLKGGLALELRLARSRTTKDIDLRLEGRTEDSAEAALETLRKAVAVTLPRTDYLTFRVNEDREHPEITGQGVKYDGYRFRAQALIADRNFGNPFGVDVIMGGPMIKPPDHRETEDLLQFIGVPPPRVRLLPIETHLAEKLHALTRPPMDTNGRVKDLPDIALIASETKVEAAALRAAFKQTFTSRNTHPVPTAMPDPPRAWTKEYERMAIENELEWKTLDEVTAEARAFLDVVLGTKGEATWSPASRTWTTEAGK